MFIVRARVGSRRGFTLLEITLAVAILAMMSLAIYRFVQANLIALRVSTQTNAVDAQYAGFGSLLASEWAALPAGVGALQGEPLKLNNRSRDEITWLASAGPGLLTRYASGRYRVSMRLRPASKETEQLEIGLARRPEGESGSSGENESWIPLLQGVQSLEIRYFDQRLNVWVEKWTDTITLPRLVKVAISRPDDNVKWETIIPLARTPL